MTLMNGYTMTTTFPTDFQIAEAFGISAIEDTAHRAFNEWKENPVYLAELVVTLNLLLWDHYNRGEEELARVYDKYWREYHNYALDNLDGEDFKTYYNIVD